MANPIEVLQRAMARAEKVRPKVGGFPVLAEILRQAGVRRNRWALPSAQSLFVTDDGPVVLQGVPLVNGWAPVPAFDGEAVVAAIRADQEGKSSFPEFLQAVWRAGVVRYDVDFDARIVVYYGINERQYYEEPYPKVDIPP